MYLLNLCKQYTSKQYKTNQNWVNLKLANRNIRNEVLRAKLKYKDRLENEFSNMNTKQAFQKVRSLAGCEFRTMSRANSAIDPAQFVKELNSFYAVLTSRIFQLNVM